MRITQAEPELTPVVTWFLCFTLLPHTLVTCRKLVACHLQLTVYHAVTVRWAALAALSARANLLFNTHSTDAIMSSEQQQQHPNPSLQLHWMGYK
ncbi:unnamed protein product [Ceratitis capitata]|uniref:(Mediterranean fruit fly) hypothetical protein n=1 Tax=Ceratitis capitata TaxID=7213 RepID=A0A811U2P3_CERCA|nr:unnamed protein product [Ceratitis capitata]